MDEYEEEKKRFFSKESDEEDIYLIPEESDDLFDISDLLKQQVNDELGVTRESLTEEERSMLETKIEKKAKVTTKKNLKYKLLKVFGISFGLFAMMAFLLVGTRGGRRLGYKLASHIILSYTNQEELDTKVSFTLEDIMSNIWRIAKEEEEELNSIVISSVRQEDYVSNYLIFGIEEIGGAKNTDSIMIASLNTKDNSVKLTSLMRDSYVEIPGWKSNKLNSAFAKGGTSMLINTIEHNYKIKIDGYAHVNFDSFEKIIDLLGGITIELGRTEAEYLNTTNYISNPANRKVRAGINNLNGNQALGYCRVRKVVTLGGANDDYGRTVRQRRVLNAIFDKYKSKSAFELLMLMDDCLGLVTTNISASDLQDAIEAVVENGITTMDSFRLPVDGMFNAPLEFSGITYPLVLDWDANIKELYKFIYLDTDEEAEAALAGLADDGL